MDYTYTYRPPPAVQAEASSIAVGTYGTASTTDVEETFTRESPRRYSAPLARVPRARATSRRRVFDQEPGKSVKSARSRNVARGKRVDSRTVAIGIAVALFLTLHCGRYVTRRLVATSDTATRDYQTAESALTGSTEELEKNQIRDSAAQSEQTPAGVRAQAVEASAQSKSLLHHFVTEMPWGKFFLANLPMVLALYAPFTAFVVSIISYYVMEVPGAVDKVLELFRRRDVSNLVTNAKVLLGSSMTTLESFEHLTKKEKTK
ncbi:putative transmembrane protein [Toxoplasma gondii VEG]|uniref:Putative transmembrane protein n=2 Tax=Toxoplasma gondii TaxID=5811 RepID=B9Q6N8_TOXGV|nr:putative transmembrane protein [Toxoplasma gondii VEG]KFG37381.1 putative transmembrane protein [Toxoplasma gondii p89]CEL76838.1 TPA: hypothetical protein BN1205_062240 [Toxoplasma gondii VEG]